MTLAVGTFIAGRGEQRTGRAKSNSERLWPESCNNPGANFLQMITIASLSPDEAQRRAPELGALLADAVRHGASVGFVEPLNPKELEAYWAKVIADVATGARVLLGAWEEGGRLLGSAQLALESRANGSHRAEVQKVLVLAAARKHGIGRALMQRVEVEARARGLRLLFLDTSQGRGGATAFYEALGYTFAGSIPDYAADPDGRLVANAIFYKRLVAAPAPDARATARSFAAAS
jgi:ribosomal protein S18 acetylase RimI-like enzyme